MSGLEIFGVVASGAGLLSLGIQLLESAVKLKRFYDAAQDAPAIISSLSFDLEIMGLALHNLEQHRQQSSRIDTHNAASVLNLCVLRCQQSTAKVKQLVDKIDQRLIKHARIGGKLYSGFKETEIRALLDELERTKSTLHLTFMTYLATERDRQNQTLVDMLVDQNMVVDTLNTRLTSTNARSDPPLPMYGTSFDAQSEFQSLHTSTSIVSVARGVPPVSAQLTGPTASVPTTKTTRNGFPSRRPVAKSERPRTRMIFRVPTWVCRRVYDISISRQQTGWNTSLRTYNVIDASSQIVKYIMWIDLDGVQRLFRDGKANPLDVTRNPYEGLGLVIAGSFGPWQTLLELAAQWGHADLSRYLLSQARWPDHGQVLAKALGHHSTFYPKDSAGQDSYQDMYQLCLSDPEFDADVSQGLRHGWLLGCQGLASLEAVLRSLPLPLQNYSLQARFEIASRLEIGEAVGFLNCVGLDASDKRLASLTNSTGLTVLHVVAQQISQFRTNHYKSTNLQSWLDLGEAVLGNGADPCALGHFDYQPWLSHEALARAEDRDLSTLKKSVHQRRQHTPLLVCLWIDDGGAPPLPVDVRMGVMQDWSTLLHRAGCDLGDVGRKESRAWRSFFTADLPLRPGGHQPYYFPLYVSSLIYGDMPKDWSFELCEYLPVDLYRLQPLPGSFPAHDRLVPEVIAWPPERADLNEGMWSYSSTTQVFRNAFDARTSRLREHEPFAELVQRDQDDCGVITGLQYRASGRINAARWSCSQPPVLRRRATAYLEFKSPGMVYDPG